MLKFVSTSETRFQQTDAAFRNQQASIQNLENQIGQISKMMTESQPGTLPSNTEPNPREHEDSGRKDGDSKVMEPKKIEARKKSPLREYQPPIPYPARLKQEKMPKYVKFLKEILSHNRKLEDLAIMTLNEECSAILQNKLLEKKRDPWSFTIPCVIGDLTVVPKNGGMIVVKNEKDELIPTRTVTSIFPLHLKTRRRESLHARIGG
eukprot:XP_015583468.1 uncharacterized protein LOC107262407 [Ricinus communis]